MKVASGIFVIILLALNNNSISGYVVYPKHHGNEDIDDVIQTWNILYDAIYKSDDLRKHFYQPKNWSFNSENFQCFWNYTLENIKSFSQAGSDMRQCVNVPIRDFQIYFKRHSLRRSKKYLTHEIIRCRTKYDDEEAYLDCYADVVFKSFKYSEMKDRQQTKYIISCIKLALKKLFENLKDNYKELRNCLNSPTTSPPIYSTTVPWTSSSSSPPNTTWSPWENSTVLPPVVNTTWNPLPNSTGNPWETTTTTWYPWPNTTWPNSTVVQPVVNTTWTPSPNSTWNPLPTLTTITSDPWSNTTWNYWSSSSTAVPPLTNTTITTTTLQLATRTTSYPWANTTWPNSTVVPPLVNTTWSPSPNTTWNPWPNSTWNPFENSTTKLPTTVNTTLNPWPNTTFNPWPTTTMNNWGPWLNTTNNTNNSINITTTVITETPTTSAPKPIWWQRIWNQITTVF